MCVWCAVCHVYVWYVSVVWYICMCANGCVMYICVCMVCVVYICVCMVCGICVCVFGMCGDMCVCMVCVVYGICVYYVV